MKLDIFDIRDKIERFEELEAADRHDEEDTEEFNELSSFLKVVKGQGGDHQWRGDWYPVTFIGDTDFEEYARELADNLGLVRDEADWPYSCIDWEEAAADLQMDYTSIEYHGQTYWYR